MSMYIYHRTDIPRIRPLSIPLVIPCPQIGNIAFRDYIHTDPFFLTQQLHIYRYVLGWKHDTSTTITLPTNNSSSSSNVLSPSYWQRYVAICECTIWMECDTVHLDSRCHYVPLRRIISPPTFNVSRICIRTTVGRPFSRKL